MRFVRDYLVPRLVQYVLVVFCGITAVFFIPRLTGQDPVLEIIAKFRPRELRWIHWRCGTSWKL